LQLNEAGDIVQAEIDLLERSADSAFGVVNARFQVEKD